MSALEDVLPNPKFTDLMQSGAALTFFEELLRRLAHQDYLSPATFQSFFSNAYTLDSELVSSRPAIHFWEHYLVKSEGMVAYQKKEVGSLIRFRENYKGNHWGLISKSYLHSLPALMALNPAQLHELEFLLNKGGETLGGTLPPVKAAPAEVRQDILIQLTVEALLSQPNVSRKKFLGRLKAEGTPEDMTSNEFADFVRDTLSKK